MKINVKSLLISGLVAGVIINISALTMIPVVGNEMDNVLTARGLPPLSNVAMVYFCIMSLMVGMLLVYLYALLKPQVGGGIKSAIIISISVWFFVYFLSNASLVAYGFMPAGFAAIGTAWGLLELLLAGIVGSKMYKG